jgi:hypothetical protein
MKARSVIVLLVLFVLLGGLVVGLDRIKAQTNKAKVTTLVALVIDQYDKVELQKGEERFVLAKGVDGSWGLIEPIVFPANRVNVTTLVQKLEKIESENVISESQDKQATFLVDDATGIIVTAYQGADQKAQFYVGKVATDFNHTYVRMAGSNEIEFALGNLNTTFWRTQDEWRDKTIVDVEQASLARVLLAKGETNYSLVLKDGGTWGVEGQDAILDQDKVKARLTTVTKMNAVGFVDDVTGAGIADLNFDAPAAKVEITLTDGTSAAVNIMEKDGTYYVRITGTDQVFKISSYIFEQVGMGWEDLKVAEVAPVTSETTTP